MPTPYKSLSLDILLPCTQPASALTRCGILAQDVDWLAYPLVRGTAGFTSLNMPDGIHLHHARIALDEPLERGTFVPYSQAHVVFEELTLQIHAVFNGSAVRGDHLNQDEFLLHEGQVFVGLGTQANFSVSFANKVVTDSVHLGVRVSALEDLLGTSMTQRFCERIRHSPLHLHTPGSDVMDNLRDSLDRTLALPLRKLHAHSRCLAFIADLAQSFLAEDARHTTLQRPRLDLEAIEAYLRSRPADRLTVADLAQAFGVSERTISNHVVRATGMPAAQFMREQRLALAHERIEHSDQSINEVAQGCGYGHLSNFSNAFRKMFGYTPTQLRQSRALRTRLSGNLHPTGLSESRWRR